jgi:hypothetical protein
MTGAFVVAALLLVIAIPCCVYALVNRKMIANENKSLIQENEDLKAKNAEYLEKGKQLFAQNKQLEEWKKCLNINARAQEMISNAQRQANEILTKAHEEANRINDLANKSVEEKTILLKRLSTQIGDISEELQSDFRKIQFENLKQGDIKKFVKPYERIASFWFEDSFKLIVSKMTSSNFTASREKMLKVINRCRAQGFNVHGLNGQDVETFITEKLRDELKSILRKEALKDEQARIREQIKEEQKALREIERLKKKEQDAIKERKKAEQAREEMRQAIADALAKANGEHTAAIIQMEKELAAKDEEIAAKQQEIDDNQRAISNAQLTKAGHVYVLSNIGSFGEGIFKIGMTRRSDPQDRVVELGDASVPFPFDVHLMVGSDNAPELENRLHRKFNNARVNRINLRKEYFRVSINEVRNEIIAFLGKDVDYVADPNIMAEYAEQYRKSQETSLEDMKEVERLMEEAGIGDEDE